MCKQYFGSSVGVNAALGTELGPDFSAGVYQFGCMESSAHIAVQTVSIDTYSNAAVGANWAEIEAAIDTRFLTYLCVCFGNTNIDAEGKGMVSATDFEKAQVESVKLMIWLMLRPRRRRGNLWLSVTVRVFTQSDAGTGGLVVGAIHLISFTLI